MSQQEDHSFHLDESIGFLVNRLAFMLRQEMTLRLQDADLGLTPEECALLMKLYEKGVMAQQELADATLRNQSTVTRLMDKMEEKGLVIRRHDDEDRRRVLAKLTTLGKQRRNAALPLIQGLLQRISKAVSKQELKSTKQSLNKMIDELLQKESESKARK